MPTSHGSPTTPRPDDLRAIVDRDGFVHIASLLAPAEIEPLRRAATRLTAAARAGDWPYMRTLPKQFPPWPADASHGIWGVQHLLHPANPDAAIFAASYFGDAVARVCKSLLRSSTDDSLVMELYNLLVRPDRDFELRWHRDDIDADASPEQELARLTAAPTHAQWNLALFDDVSLVVVPGSQRRARTETERRAHAYEKALPGSTVVAMKPGDCVFYDNNILHRGVYDSRRERMTLHGSVGLAGASEERARNVLQHGVGSWVADCDFSALDDPTRARAEGMRARLINMGSAAGHVGYFSKDE